MNRDNGNNGQRGDQERAEDMLEAIYIHWREGRAYTRSDVRQDMNMTVWEYKRLRDSLIQQGCLADIEDREQLILTPRGKERGAQILSRHHYLREFLKMVCNVDESVADADACRIEHVISDDVLIGIRDFLRSGKISNRVISGYDLNVLYEPGEYSFDVALYDNERRYPRVFCPEADYFPCDIRLTVELDKSSFSLYPVIGAPQWQLWYFHDGAWTQTLFDGEAFQLPTDVFQYTISGIVPVIEGDVLVALMRDDEAPEERNIRALNVHLW